MIRLILILLGVDYLRQRARGMRWLGGLFLLSGVVLFVDGLDGAPFFPLELFASLLLAGGICTLVVAALGAGGMRTVRLAKGMALVLAASLVLAGHHHGHFWLSMIFGTLFLFDGLLQCVTAFVIRYPRWRWSFAGGVLALAIAVFFFQPYPANYTGTVPYALSLWLLFGGWSMVALARRARHLPAQATVDSLMQGPRERGRLAQAWHRESPPGAAVAAAGAAPATGFGTNTDADAGQGNAPDEGLTVHVWTPGHALRGRVRRRPLVGRYIAAVDANGAIWTGHVALEAPQGVYISLDPATPMERSPENLARVLRASPDNNVQGLFEADYPGESRRRGDSTVRVRIRNYDADRLQRFWERYREDTTYNLTYRNCAVSVVRALEASIEGAISRRHGNRHSWGIFLRVLLTPELWVAAQLRKRGKTMAWTPGLVLDYSRALRLLVDPRPRGGFRFGVRALRGMRQRRRAWREDGQEGGQKDGPDTEPPPPC